MEEIERHVFRRIIESQKKEKTILKSRSWFATGCGRIISGAAQTELNLWLQSLESLVVAIRETKKRASSGVCVYFLPQSQIFAPQ